VDDPPPRRRVLTMDYVLVAALALSLGLVLGFGAGAVRALRIEARRRAAAGASGVLAQVWGEGAPRRSPADVWAGRIRIVLGGIEYILPVAPRKVAREWLASLDGSFAATAALIEAKEVPDALRALAGQTDTLYDLLADYAARVGITLPERDSELDFASDTEILRATVEVWAALHPLAVALATSETGPTSGPSAVSTTSSPPSTGGVANTSTTFSPTSSSSPTSTPPPSASSPVRKPRGPKPSSPSASATSSPETTSSTASGAAVPAKARASAASPAPLSSRP
jgi:hypothetical protein